MKSAWSKRFRFRRNSSVVVKTWLLGLGRVSKKSPQKPFQKRFPRFVPCKSLVASSTPCSPFSFFLVF